VHALCHKEVVLGAGNDVDNGITDAEHVVTKRGHAQSSLMARALYRETTPRQALAYRG
jgi:hypothetical protein